MRKLTLLIIIGLFLAASLSGCSAIKSLGNIFRFREKDEFNYGVTAQQWFAAIDQRAKEWRPDAYLYGISETEVNLEGSSDKWTYLYYSPGSSRTAIVVYEAGFISFKEAVMSPLNPVINLQIDSPTAINIAKNENLKFLEENKDASAIISLVGPSFGGKSSAAPRWLIKFYGETGMATTIIDAVNGKVL
jgi:hypothetical protein